MVYRKTSCDANKLPLQNTGRKFSLGKVRMDKPKENLGKLSLSLPFLCLPITFYLQVVHVSLLFPDQIEVDGLSKIALVVDGKYKTLKDVPAFLP